MGGCTSKQKLNELQKKKSFSKDSEIEDKSSDHRDVNGFSPQLMKSPEKKIIKKTLSKHFLFKQFTKDQLLLLYQVAKKHEFNCNETVYERGNVGNRFYIITKGSAEISKGNADLVKLSKGDTFGEMALLTQLPYKETVRARKDLWLWSIERVYFKKILKRVFFKDFDRNREFVCKIHLFSISAESQKDALTRLLVHHEYRENDVIAREKEENELIYILIEGKVKFLIRNKEQHTIEPGGFFGESCLLTGSSNPMTAIAATSCKILSLGKSALISVFGDNFREVIFKNIAKFSILSDNFLDFLSKENIILLVESLEWNQYHADNVVIGEEFKENPRIMIVCTGKISSESGKSIENCQVIGFHNNNERNLGDDYFVAGNNTVIGEADKEYVEKLLKFKISSNYQEADSIKMLKNVSIFKYLSLSKLKTLSCGVYPEIYDKKEVIFAAKTPAVSLFIIKEGVVEIYNERKIYRTIGKNEVFGERCITESLRSASARAKTRTECWVIPIESLKAVMDDTINSELVRKKYYQADIMLNNLLFLQVVDDKSDRKTFITYYQKDSAYYNVQVISKAKYTNSDQCVSLVQEKNINLQLDFYLIVKLVKTFTDSEYVYFVTEHINGVNLREVIRTFMRESFVRFVISCIITILEYLHDKNIVYRDLCPENIIINNFGYPHLYNFTSSKVIKGRTFTNIGNPFYRSPEIIMGRGYSKSTDYWSLGVIVFEMLYKELPFGMKYTDDPVTVYEKILKNNITFSATQQFVLANAVIERLLINDIHRAQAEDIKKSMWLRNCDWDKLTKPSTKSFCVPKLPLSKLKPIKENMITLERFLYEGDSPRKSEQIYKRSYSSIFKWEKYF